MAATPTIRLQDIADRVGGKVHGDPQGRVHGLATLQSAGPGQLSFFANGRYLPQLRSTNAAAVLVRTEHLDSVPQAAIEVDDPYLAYARVSQLFDWRQPSRPGVHPSAVVADTVQLDPTAEVSALAVIGAGSQIGAGAFVGPHAVIGADCQVGENSRVEAGVVLYDNVSLGARCIVHSGAVLGADGFGFAPDSGNWVKICQLGGVRVGNDVEIGAGTTIDRGALDDTCIGDGVKLDNQVQIAHNVQIGAGTAIAGCTAVAGSTKIGERCTIAGLSGITGHLTIAAGTHITAMSLVSKSISQPGAYSSGTGLQPHGSWKRNVVRFKQLDELSRRVAKLEQTIELNSIEGHKE
ncbi:UDP-3-O-(3-hydroxymyristoyl)glucosamine N-acyltransferase [Marinobacterium rhizophilum]|uniref:UDP-3-O-acylglucosamine N-acyltransferase n=1 Tax=Marinobacterium rhizophilum TaxID=420402 RepID=A0ABY5HG56_9GAMM|nr:UDP-3-O-(3-hydroxymyristoyl)glucosamine N-acyltransferase [Marinobacterium rhizophilum]UTW10292.1 UDP-3-O-(3-hydroxymyristoyl)glucosamine N-acyltransferase [Marinobacterium rhizophilum]